MSKIITSNYYEVIDGTTMYYEDYVEQLQKENEELKKQVDIQHNGFMASVDETCEYATILEKFEKWLEKTENGAKINPVISGTINKNGILKIVIPKIENKETRKNIEIK